MTAIWIAEHRQIKQEQMGTQRQEEILEKILSNGVATSIIPSPPFLMVQELSVYRKLSLRVFLRHIFI
jgi:hypothetical protein